MRSNENFDSYKKQSGPSNLIGKSLNQSNSSPFKLIGEH